MKRAAQLIETDEYSMAQIAHGGGLMILTISVNALSNNMALPQLSTKKAGSRTWINGKISNAFCSLLWQNLAKEGAKCCQKTAARHLCYQPLIYRLLFKNDKTASCTLYPTVMRHIP